MHKRWNESCLHLNYSPQSNLNHSRRANLGRAKFHSGQLKSRQREREGVEGESASGTGKERWPYYKRAELGSKGERRQGEDAAPFQTRASGQKRGTSCISSVAGIFLKSITRVSLQSKRGSILCGKHARVDAILENLSKYVALDWLLHFT